MVSVVYPADSANDRRSSLFAATFLGIAIGAFLLAGWAPLQFSIVIVFLFAAPHNWAEARYFMSRMPARWGTRKAFYSTGIVGVVTLTLASFLIPSFARSGQWNENQWMDLRNRHLEYMHHTLGDGIGRVAS